MAERPDPNTQLGPFVEGMLMAVIDWQRLDRLLQIGWQVSLEELDRHALIFISPSGLRWRIVAELLEDTQPAILDE